MHRLELSAGKDRVDHHFGYGFDPDAYCFVIDRFPTPAELRVVENEERMLLNVLSFDGHEITPIDMTRWTEKYLADAGLWPSTRMAIRFAMAGEDPSKVAADWARSLEGESRLDLLSSVFKIQIDSSDDG